MLGCQDFCGYYDWTFHFVRTRFGETGLRRFWAEAIGGESQAHYAQAGTRDGLRGLRDTWARTGADEHCDWTFTLDEPRNTLRWDMRKCPSKGFLIENDLNAHEDYCDHCMGWIIPLLNRIGAEVVAHEHNHCGQCWAEISIKERPREPLELPVDIRRDPSWNRGYLDRWNNGRKLELLAGVGGAVDPADVLRHWFSRTDHLTVLGDGPSASEAWARGLPGDAVLVTDTTYATGDVFAGEPLGVLIGNRPIHLGAVAARFHATPADRRPLIMHLYLPGIEPIDFVSTRLPRPVPILPLLIREGFYAHQPGVPHPTPGIFMTMLAISLGKRVDVAGLDLDPHSSGRADAGGQGKATEIPLPPHHTRQCDLDHLRRALAKAVAPVRLPPDLQNLIPPPPAS